MSFGRPRPDPWFVRGSFPHHLRVIFLLNKKTLEPSPPTRKYKKKSAKTIRGLVTRAGARKILGISMTELKRCEGDKIYPFEIDPETGWHLFDPHVLIKMARRAGGEERAKPYLEAAAEVVIDRSGDHTPDNAKKVFAALRDGKKPVEIVIDLGVLPEVVRNISAQYFDFDGGLYLSRASMEKIGKLPMTGAVDLDSEEEFVATIARSLANIAGCAKCKKRPARVCGLCVANGEAPVTPVTATKLKAVVSEGAIGEVEEA